MLKKKKKTTEKQQPSYTGFPVAPILHSFTSTFLNELSMPCSSPLLLPIHLSTSGYSIPTVSASKKCSWKSQQCWHIAKPHKHFPILDLTDLSHAFDTGTTLFVGKRLLSLFLSDTGQSSTLSNPLSSFVNSPPLALLKGLGLSLPLS